MNNKIFLNHLKSKKVWDLERVSWRPLHTEHISSIENANSFFNIEIGKLYFTRMISGFMSLNGDKQKNCKVCFTSAKKIKFCDFNVPIFYINCIILNDSIIYKDFAFIENDVYIIGHLKNDYELFV